MKLHDCIYVEKIIFYAYLPNALWDLEMRVSRKGASLLAQSLEKIFAMLLTNLIGR